MVYPCVHTQARPETFIPIIGGLVGGADAQTQTTLFTFSPDGMLRTGSQTQSEAGVRMGV